MADVLITPATGLIEFKDSSSVVDATIQLDGSGNLNVTHPGGNLNLGNPGTPVYIGDGINSVDIIFEQSGKVRALTGKTLTLGQSDSTVAIASPLTVGSTSSFTGNMLLPTGAGNNTIKAGTGDGASFTTYNLKINSWWGIGFGDYQDLATVKAYLDCRTGNFGTSGQIVSAIATGTAPFTVASTTRVSNLNVATAGTADTATNLSGGAANRIPYNTGAGATTFVVAPTTSDTALKWNGSAFIWASAGGVQTTDNIQVFSLGVGTAASGTAGEIRATSQITSYYSDERLKTDILPIENAINKVMQLRGVTFRANSLAESFGYSSEKEQVGVIAQDVKKVLPQIVVPAPFDVISIDEHTQISRSGENYLTVHYEKLVPLLIEAIKEQQKQIQELKAKVGN